MKEAEWVELIAERIRSAMIQRAKSLEVRTGLKLAYGYEIKSYGKQPVPQSTAFQTDLAIIETNENGSWIPRVVIEAKVESVTTHHAITYSQKAAAHRSVHPYLRYGVMLGNRGHYPLPGRLYRHGVQFDFMVSFQNYDPTEKEMREFMKLLRTEIQASRTLEKILYENRRPDRDRYTILQRKLELK